MTLGDILTKARNLTGTDSNSYTNANALIDLNLWLQKIVGMIFDSQDESDWDDQRNSDYPIKKTSLVASQRDYRIPVSEKVLKIKDLTIYYDGVNGYRATPIDLTEFEDLGNAPSNATGGTTQNAKIDAYFSRTTPGYDYKYNSIWLYPTCTATDVSAGAFMLIEWFRQATEFTSAELSTGTVVPGFDDTFHAMLAYGMAFEYASSKQLPQLKQIQPILADFEARLRKQYSVKQGDRQYQLKQSYQNYK